MKTNELIIVKQLPVIEEHLKVLAAEVKKDVETAKGLVCTADTIKSVKSTRASLNKKFKELEGMRKKVKTEVMNPYADFEKIYKECVTDPFKDADVTLKSRIAEVENEVKQQKENDVKDYFSELLAATEIDFISYEDAGIKVGLSNSVKSLKEQAETFINGIVSDLTLIDTQEHKADILVEYKQSLNCSEAITKVVNRYKAIEEEKKRQAEIERKKAEAKARAEEEKKRQAEIERKKAEAKARAEEEKKAEFAANSHTTVLPEIEEKPEPIFYEHEMPFEEAFNDMFLDKEPEIQAVLKLKATQSMLDDLEQFLNERKYNYTLEV